MFDILEADIVTMQETKIQRKDLQDDMVLVPGWDVFFSLPKHKKGMTLKPRQGADVDRARLFRSRHLHAIERLRSDPCRRRNHRHPLPAQQL